MSHRITIEPTHIALETGQRYRVHHEGRVLLENTRVPLLDACRALLAEGITRRLEMWRAGRSHWDAAADIEVGAGWTVRETRDEFACWAAAHVVWHRQGDVGGLVPYARSWVKRTWG